MWNGGCFVSVRSQVAGLSQVARQEERKERAKCGVEVVNVGTGR